MKTQMFTKENTNVFARYLIEGGSYLFAAVSLFFVFQYFYKENTSLKLIISISSALVFVLMRAVLVSYYAKPKKEETSSYRFFFKGLKVIIVIILLLGLWGVYQIVFSGDCGKCPVYQAIGLGIIVIWACVFLSYFIWAVYYYNINLGLPEDEWNKIFKAKELKAKGELFSEDDLKIEPKHNPYRDQTFGLPDGTVRGMIAFTLLFGAISMLIVSIGMENQLDTNSMFWDQYEFFKTAFLMMIAFYFGNSALKLLRDKNNPPDPENNDNNQNDSGEQIDVSTILTDTQAQELPVENPMDNPEATKPKPAKKEPKPGESIFDPMKQKL